MIKNSKRNSPIKIHEIYHRNAHDLGRQDRVGGRWIVETQNEIEEVVQIEEEKDRDHMIVEEIAIVMEDAIVTETVIEIDVDRDHVIVNGQDHVIGNIENKPLPYTIDEFVIPHIKCIFLFRNEIQSCSSRRFKLVCDPT